MTRLSARYLLLLACAGTGELRAQALPIRPDRPEAIEEPELREPAEGPGAPLPLDPNSPVSTLPDPETPIDTWQFSHSYGLLQDELRGGMGYARGRYAEREARIGLTSNQDAAWIFEGPEAARGQVEAESLWNRQFGRHQPEFRWGWTGRQYEDFALNLLDQAADARRLNQDLEDYRAPVTQKSAGNVGLGETYRMSGRTELGLDAEYRHDHRVIRDQLEETSRYQTARIDWTHAWRRDHSVELRAQRSTVDYKDHQSGLSLGQGLTDLEARTLFKIYGPYSAGFGYQVLNSERHGPSVSLVRRPDDRGEAQLRFSVLRGDDSTNIFGLALWVWRLTKAWRLTLSAEQNVDLLASYALQNNGNGLQGGEQRWNRNYRVQGLYEEGDSRLESNVRWNLQDYAGGRVQSQSIDLRSSWKLGRRDITSLAFEHIKENDEGAIFQDLDRRYLRWELGYQHIFGYESLRRDGRIFFESAIFQEEVKEGSRTLERLNFRIGLGQAIL